MSTGHGTARKRSLRALLRGLLWISPWLAGFALFTAAPIAMSLYYSFTDYTLLDAPVFVGLANYAELLADPMVGIATGNTLYYALLATAGSTLASLGVAWLLEQRLRGTALVRAVIFLPTLVPVVSSAVCWLWLFNGRFGLINGALGAAGVSGPDWLGERATAMPSLIIMSLWAIGSPLLVCTAALKDVPRTLYEAADLDGLVGLRRFCAVTLPLISPAVLFNALMSLIWSLQVFAAPQIMTKGGPENSTMVYSMYVYSNAFVYGRMGYASALAWLQVLVTLLLTVGVLLLGRRFVYYRAA